MDFKHKTKLYTKLWDTLQKGELRYDCRFYEAENWSHGIAFMYWENSLYAILIFLLCSVLFCNNLYFQRKCDMILMLKALCYHGTSFFVFTKWHSKFVEQCYAIQNKYLDELAINFWINKTKFIETFVKCESVFHTHNRLYLCHVPK